MLHTRLVQESTYRFESSFGACNYKVVGNHPRYVYMPLVSVNVVVYRRLHPYVYVCVRLKKRLQLRLERFKGPSRTNFVLQSERSVLVLS